MLRNFQIVTAILLVLVQTLGFAAGKTTNKSPTVSLTSPTSGTTYAAPANVVLTATAADSDGTVARVDFYQGTTLLGTKTAAPYALTWANVAGGSYSLTAKATDNLGATTTSTAVSITVTGPKLIVSSPVNGSTIYSTITTVSGSFNGDASSTVLISNGDTSRVATVSASSYTATLPVNIGPNNISVTVTRTDKTSDTSTINVTGNFPPQIAFLSPSATTFDNTVTSSILFAVDAVSPAGTISQVRFFKNGSLVSTLTTPPYQYTLANPLATSYNVWAIATDNNGVTYQQNYPAITVLGPNTSPTVSLTTPANGSVYAAPINLNIVANASDPDGSIALVEFLQNGNVISSTNSSPYQFAWQNVGSGSYALTARATDNRGGLTTSAPVNIIVDALPTVSLTAPLDGATAYASTNLAISANANDADGTIAQVQFYQGTTLLGFVNTPPYTFTWSNIPVGSYTLTAQAIDNIGGHTTSAPVNVNILTGPLVSLSSPTSGSQIVGPTDIVLSANATDNSGAGISKVEFYQGNTLLGSVASAPYNFTWGNVSPGTYTVTARVISNSNVAVTSSAVTFTVVPPSISITSPLAEASINTSTVRVTGVVQAPPYSGVVVNGVIAIVDSSGNFFANNVPLAVGNNTLTATVTTPSEFTQSQSVSVTGGTPGPIEIFVNSTVGVGSAKAIFSVHSTNPLQTLELDFTSNGSYDFTGPSDLYINFNSPGTYQTTARATDVQGNVITQVFTTQVKDTFVVDQMYNDIWARLIGKLKVGDITGALTSITNNARGQYQSVFTNLQNNLPNLDSSFGTLTQGNFSEDTTEYVFTRNSTNGIKAYLIYFVLGTDGVWRIEGM